MENWTRAWCMALLLPALAGLHAQQALGTLAQPGAPGQWVREIDDPYSGARWMLGRNGAHPGGPGRLIPLAPGAKEPGSPERQAAVPVVRAGDQVLVEEHTPVADAVLVAEALSGAAAGRCVRVRLVTGGHVVQAMVLGPGRVRFAPETEVRP